MKYLFFALLFGISPIFHASASTPKSVTCTRTEYREEYIPGTKSSPGYVRSYEIDVEIPCGGEKAEKIEVLRALEDGMDVKIVEVDYQGRTHWAVDSQQDVEIVERIIADEGELV